MNWAEWGRCGSSALTQVCFEVFRCVKDTGRIIHVGLRGVEVRVSAEQLRNQRQHQRWVTGTQKLQTPETERRRWNSFTLGTTTLNSSPHPVHEAAKCPHSENPIISHTQSVLLPDRVAIGGIFVEVLQQLQQSQLDALFSGDVGVTD